jgi:hypothetical protein
MLDSLNSWAHNVRVKKPKASKTLSTEAREIDKLANFVPKAPKTLSKEDREIDKLANFVSSKKKPSHDIVIVHSEKELDKASNLISPLPTDRKGIHKIVKRFDGHIKLAPDERLVMVDSGSFCHAIDAEVELPEHELIKISKDEGKGDGESACGSIMRRLGKVKTQGSVEGVSLNVLWNAMKVKVPILSVRRLVRDRHSVRFRDDGGYIRNLATGEKIPFFEFQGVYYLIMKIKPPPEPEFSSNSLCTPCPVDNKPVFSRQVP